MEVELNIAEVHEALAAALGERVGKLPKAVVFRDEILRSPSGKADYRWARAQPMESGD